jgi:hypothetical protein
MIFSERYLCEARGVIDNIGDVYYKSKNKYVKI